MVKIRDSKKRKPKEKSGRYVDIKKVSHWKDAMKDVPCFIIGNGPSLKKIDLGILKPYFTIGINRAFLKIDPTVLIWQDLSLWMKEKKAVLATKALKYCRLGAETKGNFYHFRLSGSKSKISDTPSILYGRGNSGPIAYQFAYAIGCNPIILVGIDCKYDKDGNTNFYGINPMHRGHTLKSCKEGLKWMQSVDRTKTIINCSKNKVFIDRITVEEAVEKYAGPPQCREYWVDKLKNTNKKKK